LLSPVRLPPKSRIILFVISVESYQQEIEGRSQPLSACRVAGGTARGRTGSASQKALMRINSVEGKFDPHQNRSRFQRGSERQPGTQPANTAPRKFDTLTHVAFRSSQRNLPSTILAFGPRCSPYVALDEHETQRQGEKAYTCPKRVKTYAALY